jgi:hypothetical protein
MEWSSKSANYAAAGRAAPQRMTCSLVFLSAGSQQRGPAHSYASVVKDLKEPASKEAKTRSHDGRIGRAEKALFLMGPECTARKSMADME